MNRNFEYILRIADNSLILGHRLSEWCGHGPVLEQDMAMTNIALDLVGQARSLYTLAAEVQNEGKTEDDLAFLRDVFDFKNLLIVEQPNGDFAYTVVRQFFFSAFQLPFYKELCHSTNEILRGVAEKAVKEVSYHLRWSSEWVIRLGDGTEESHQRIQKAVNDLWTYSGEAFMMDELDNWAVENGIGVDLNSIKPIFNKTIDDVLNEATLLKPAANYMQSGGKKGYHTEHLGFLLAEMQFLQRAYPNATW
jgi:ring-1,2-phenylacetyl-CoA epoxidase subunit PaaC